MVFITYLNGGFKGATRLLLIALLTFFLTLTEMPITVSQIPIFSKPSTQKITETPGWDLNKAYYCGKFWCSDVYFYRFSTTDPLSADLTLALLPADNQSELEVAKAVEQRAKLVERSVTDIFLNIIRGQNIAESPVVEHWKSWLPRQEKSLHPWTPKIEVGIQNDLMVVYVPAQPELGLAQQAIVTVTEVDAKANGTTKQELAQYWRTNIRLSFSSAFWGHQLDVQHPWCRWAILGALSGAVLMLISIINGIQGLLSQRSGKLKGQIKQLTNPFAGASEAVSAHKIDARASTAQDDSTPRKPDTSSPSEAMTSEQDNSPSISVELKSDVSPLEQQRNFIQLCQRILLLAQVLILLFGLGLMVSTFALTRFLFNLFFTKPVFVIGTWILLFLADKILDITIDYALHRWRTQAQMADPSSNRYTLRFNTYSLTFKKAKTFLLVVLAIYLTVWIIGINPVVLASAGAVALVLAFLSQNLLKDMLNGLLILLTDRYAMNAVKNCDIKERIL